MTRPNPLKTKISDPLPTPPNPAQPNPLTTLCCIVTGPENKNSWRTFNRKILPFLAPQLRTTNHYPIGYDVTQIDLLYTALNVEHMAFNYVNCQTPTCLYCVQMHIGLMILVLASFNIIYVYLLVFVCVKFVALEVY